MSTGIPYIDEAWNVISGCSGKGCKANCWAREMVKRFPAIHEHEQLEYPGIGVPFNKVQFHPDRLDKPLHWRKPRRVGVCFMGDWMDEQVIDEWIGRILAIISDCPQHTFFTLTKQVDRLANIRPSLPNLYNGISITDQEDWTRAKGDFLKIPGKKWLSIEPMLGPIDLDRWVRSPGTAWICPFSWIALGCESGPKRRPCPQEWAIDIRNQCSDANVPLYIKQLDIGGHVVYDINLFPFGLQVRHLP